MNEITFATNHARICKRKNKHSPCAKLHCGKKLFRFLTKYKKPLDIYYNQKRLGIFKE